MSVNDGQKALARSRQKQGGQNKQLSNQPNLMLRVVSAFLPNIGSRCVSVFLGQNPVVWRFERTCPILRVAISELFKGKP